METLILIAIVVLTQLVKNYIKPKFGDTGVHIFIFAIAMIGSAIHLGAQHSATFGIIVGRAIGFLALSVTAYEVILKQIGINSITGKKVLKK